MLAFLSAETMFFAGLISAFFVLRLSAAVWPPPLQPRLPVLVTGLNTLVLLASSVAMLAALRASEIRKTVGNYFLVNTFDHQLCAFFKFE
jgi:heme/copper-type cytochrome/quinol oxidase subunit 3